MRVLRLLSVLAIFVTLTLALNKPIAHGNGCTQIGTLCLPTPTPTTMPSAERYAAMKWASNNSIYTIGLYGSSVYDLARDTPVTIPTISTDINSDGTWLYSVGPKTDYIYYWQSGGRTGKMPLGEHHDKWNYGNTMLIRRGKLFVLHFWEHKASVVDLRSKKLETVFDTPTFPTAIEGDDTNANRLLIATKGDRCSTVYPPVVYRVRVDNGKVNIIEAVHLPRPSDGQCFRSFTQVNGCFAIAYDGWTKSEDVLRVYGENGNVLFDVNIDATNLAQYGDNLAYQTMEGDVGILNVQTGRVVWRVNILHHKQEWYPPLGKMVANGKTLIVPNINDATIEYITPSNIFLPIAQKKR